MKRLLCLTLGILMLCCSLPAPAESALPYMENYYYSVTDSSSAYYRHFYLLNQESFPMVRVGTKTASALEDPEEYIVFPLPSADSYCKSFNPRIAELQDLEGDREIDYEFWNSSQDIDYFLKKAPDPGLVILDGSTGAAAYLDVQRGLAYGLIPFSGLSEGGSLHVTIHPNDYRSLGEDNLYDALSTMIREEVSRIQREARVEKLDRIWTRGAYDGIRLVGSWMRDLALSMEMPDVTFHTVGKGEVSGKMFITSCSSDGFGCAVMGERGQAVNLDISISTYSVYYADADKTTDYTLGDGSVWGLCIRNEEGGKIRSADASRRIGKGLYDSEFYLNVSLRTGSADYMWPDRETLMADLEAVLQFVTLGQAGRDNPVITAQPESQVVEAGEKAIFRVEASGKDLKYQWYYRKSLSSDWVKVSKNGTSSSFSLNAQDKFDLYGYRCEVSNAYGSVFSDTAFLSVLSFVSAPTITSHPDSLEVKAGEKAIFKVGASGDELKYQWYYQKPDASDWTMVSKNGTSASYSINAADKFNGYSYRCKVSNTSGYEYSVPAILVVLSSSRPAITSQPESVSAKAGEKAKFKISASGEDLKYQWYYRKPGASDWTMVSKNGTSAAFSLNAADKFNGYSYRCEVYNAFGSIFSDAAILTIETPKPAVTSQPESVRAEVGEKAKFKVSASGEDLKYQWYYKKSGASDWTMVSKNGTSATYSINAADKFNGYSYRCEVSNAYGSVFTDPATLTIVSGSGDSGSSSGGSGSGSGSPSGGSGSGSGFVPGRSDSGGSGPDIFAQPRSSTVEAGEMVIFRIAASGKRLTYQWYYQKPGDSDWTEVTVGGDSFTYIFTASGKQNGYVYRCKVSDETGYTYSDPVTLTVK